MTSVFRGRLRPLLGNALAFVVAVVVAESGLQLATLLSDDIALITTGHKTPRIVEDERLRHRGNPAFPEHDSLGFRNASAQGRAEIVALGDSHTYGTSVDPDQAWPKVLGDISERDVYNMGMGGYGTAHALSNLPIALRLQPEVVLLGVYFGNDFYDNFQFVQRNGMLDEFVTDDSRAEIDRLELQSSIEDEVGFLFRSGRSPTTEPAGGRGIALRSLRDLLFDHSRLYGVLSTLRAVVADATGIGLLTRDFERAVEGLSTTQSNFVSVYAGPEWRTILTAPVRRRVLAREDPRIGVGVEVGKANLEELNERVRTSGADFVIVLLPTKEFVFWPRIDRPQEHELLAELVDDEQAIRDDLIRFMTARGIDFVDPAAALRSAGIQPYFENGNGHPNPSGHRLIARAVYEFLDGSRAR